MPKNLPLKVKLRTQGPVAARTRLKLGTPLYKSQPIQYPDAWPLLHKAILYSKLQSTEDERDDVTSAEKRKRQYRSFESRKNGQGSMSNIDLGIRREAQKANIREKIGRSLVDFVTSSKGNILLCSAGTRNRNRNKKAKIKRRLQQAAKSRKTRRVSRKRRRKTHLCQRKHERLERSRRREASKKQRKKKASKRSTRRKSRRKNNRHGGARRTLAAAPPLGHAHDDMLKQKSTVNTEWFETGTDEVKDDPLNIDDMCRSLVKNLPGIPADCREENFDEKRTKPEHAKRDKTVYDLKVHSQCFKETESNGAASTSMQKKSTHLQKPRKYIQRHPSRKLKDLTKNKHPRSDDAKRNSRHILRSSEENIMQMTRYLRRACNRKRGYQRSETTELEAQKDGLSDDVHNSASVDLGQEEDVTVAQGISVGSLHRDLKKQGKPFNDLEKEQEQKTRSEKDDQSSEKRQGREGNHSFRAHSTESRTTTANVNLSTDYKQEPEQEREKLTGTESKSEAFTEHLSGLRLRRMRPRNKETNYFKEHRTRKRMSTKESLLKRRSSRAKKCKTGNHQRASRQLCEKMARHHFCRARDARRCRRKRATTVSRRYGERDRNCNGNGNDNVNNNQTEIPVWGRIFGRLVRIGRYLLRKFHLLDWQ